MTATPIKRENIIKTYNGLTGCACGCGGDYIYPEHSTEASAEWGKRSNAGVTRRLNFINAHLDRAEIDTFDDEIIYSVENEDGTRVTRIYAKRETTAL